VTDQRAAATTGAAEALAARVAEAVADAAVALPPGTDVRLQRLSLRLPPDAGAADVAAATRAALAAAMERKA
jgi:hypothetical protein